jgi:predicted phosphodiesterase
MTKFQIISDTHLEFDNDKGINFIDSLPRNADNLIIAGDFMPITANTMQLFTTHMENLCEKFKNVVYVTGNHEYYGNFIDQVNAVVSNLQVRCPNFYFLNNSCANIDGKKISGCTMWFKRSHETAMYMGGFSDFHYIKDNPNRLFEENDKCLEFLKDNLDSDIIVTHHMPSSKSTPSQFEGSPINCYFVCDVEELLRNFNGTWVHGHTHTPIAYKIVDATVVCNPRGYPGENEGPYDTGYII